jgi:ankyrin repeat protein
MDRHDMSGTPDDSDPDGSFRGQARQLFEAIDRQDAELVRRLLKRDPTLATARDDEGISALMQSIYRPNVELLAAVRANVRELDVFEGAACGDVDRLSTLTASEPALVGAYSPDGFTPLHFAAFFGRESAVELLLARGADVNARGRGWMTGTPLHSAVSQSEASIGERLLRAGADPNLKQAAGWTPLHAAAQNGDLVSVALLLEAGADPHATTDDGRTASDLARQSPEPATSTKLLASLVQRRSTADTFPRQGHGSGDISD